MMRLNATLPAFLALAVLFLLPATLLATTAHRHARKATAPAQTHKKTTAKARKTSAHSSKKSTTAHATRVRSHAKTRRPVARKTKAVRDRSAVRRRSVAETTHRKARSADFLEAAANKKDTAPRAAEPVAVQKASGSHSRVEDAAIPAVLPTLYNKRGRLIVPPPLKGSREILVRQNEVADREGLDRIQNMANLLDMRDKRMLVPLPANYSLQVDDRLPADRRYCRPWTARFLANMARAHYARFHTPLQVNSAVRTVEFQQRLIRVNGNAAPAEGDTASPHLTGQAIDIAKHGLSRTEIAWMRGYLLPLIQEGKIDVEEEFQQACFHISVYKKYLPPSVAPKRDVATHRHSEASTLATAIQ